MPVRDLYKEQKDAASSVGSEIIVSAGAGSGKTRLLVSRYLYLVLMEKLSLSSIAAITFTNKAADQMKIKVAQEAARLAELYPNDRDFWLHAAGEVNFARISTIHSFCSSILRSYPLESGIDPFFTVIEEFAAEKLKKETIDNYLKSYMTDQPENASFILDTFGINGLKNILRTLLTKRINVLKFLDSIHSNGYLDSETLEKAYITDQLSIIDGYIKTLHSFHAISPAEDLMTAVCDNLLQSLRKIRYMINVKSVDDKYIMETVKNINLRGGSGNKWGKNTLISVKSNLSDCKEFLTTLRLYYKYEKGRTGKSASILMGIFSELEKNYLERKKALSFLDNDDILIETWKLLRNNSNLCGKISKSFKHILVDEFQDTDDLQMDILRMIAGNSTASLFVVGDEKQSIYRFRGADVTVFRNILSNPNIESFHLDMNYRSVPGILDFVNNSFCCIMGKEPLNKFEAHYSVSMKPFRKNESQLPPVDITVFSGNCEARRKLEADYIAKKAIELRNDYNFKDMALLLRTRTAVEIYEEAFLKNNVPFVNLAGSKIPGSPGVFDIGNLLGWLANPSNPGLLISVLLSPFFSTDPDTLLQLRDIAVTPEKMGSLVFYDEIALNQKKRIPSGIKRSFDLLRELHTMSERESISEIIKYALDKTSYSQVILADPIKGERSLSVTDLLIRSADSFERNGGNMREFADILLSGEDFTEESAVIESTGDSLQILTIHGAKGLEFKVVFLADLSSTRRRGQGDIFFNEDLGPGFKILDERGRSQDTYVSSRSAGLEKKKETAESKRLFYVGCTRAKDRLFITGATPPMSSDNFYEKDDWMNWLHTVHNLHTEECNGVVNEKLFRYESISGDADKSNSFLSEKWHEALQPAIHPVSEVDNELLKLLHLVKQIKESTLPQKLSPTQIINYTECPAFYYLQSITGINSFNGGSEAVNGGPAYGTYFHRVMAALDLKNPDTWIETSENVSPKNIQKQFITRIHDELSLFKESEFYKRLINAGKIKKEETFALMQDDVLIRGTVDLIFSHNGNIYIADYKTDKGEPEKLKEKLSGYSLQLGIYALAYSKAKYVNPGLLTIYYTATGENVDINCDETFLRNTEKIVNDTIKSISDGNFEHKKCGKCQYCSYRDACGIKLS